jgi:hypothetical protein
MTRQYTFDPQYACRLSPQPPPRLPVRLSDNPRGDVEDSARPAMPACISHHR